MRDIIIFFHVGVIGNYLSIYNEIINNLIDSGLYNKASSINISVVGNPRTDLLVFPEKSNIIYNNDLEKGEFITLEMIKSFSDSCIENKKVLYIHTKGATSNPNNLAIIDWRKYMSYFNIDKHIEAIEFLDKYDACGVDLVDDPCLHFSGNFWWANTDYIKLLPKIEEIVSPSFKSVLTLRHNAEFWIGMGQGKLKSIHNSNINVYERHLTEFSKEKYICS